MKYIIVAIVLISGVLSAPAPQESSAVSQVVNQAAATIVRYFFDWYPNNEGYRYTYVV